jgi:hypothetical protein
MLYRVTYAFAHRRLCCKRDAGRWALEGFGEPRWRPLLETALSRYEAGVPDDAGPSEELLMFERCCREFIAGLTAERAWRLAGLCPVSRAPRDRPGRTIPVARRPPASAEAGVPDRTRPVSRRRSAN